MILAVNITGNRASDGDKLGAGSDGEKGLFLVASPEQVAKSALKTLQKPSGIYYIPRFWRMIMLVVRWIPEPVFKRLKL